MLVIRKYAHKTLGMIGQVELEVPGDGWTIDGKALPESTIKHLANFALQSLQDAYAGSDSIADAQGAWGKKLDRLLDGKIGTRVSGVSDPFEAECFKIARAIVVGAVKAKGLKVTKEWLDEKVAEYREAKAESIEAQATANLEAIKAQSADVNLDDLLAGASMAEKTE